MTNLHKTIGAILLLLCMCVCAWGQLPIDPNPEYGGKWLPRTGTLVKRDGPTGAPVATLALDGQLSWTSTQAATASTTAIHAAVTDNATNQTITTGITAPPCGRNLSVTYGGSTITAVGPTIYGNDMAGAIISEALPVATVNTTGTKYGTKIFAGVSSVYVPVNASGATMAIGTGSKLGVPFKLSSSTVSATCLNGTLEGTAPTVTFDPANLYANGITLNSSLNSTPVTCYVKVP